MTKNLSLCFLLLLICASPAICQSIKNDVLKAADKDSRLFKMDKAVWKQFRNKHFAYTSDYFKPQAANVGDTAMLSDSVYVTAYRQAAYARTLHRHTTGHYILVYGGIYFVATVITFIAVFISISHHGTYGS